MAQAQLRTGELVAFPIIENIRLGLFSELPFPEKEVSSNPYPKPLSHGHWNPGGKIVLNSVEGWREYDPRTDETLLAALAPYEGGTGQGVLPYHAAPGHVPSPRPIVGHTYDIVLLRAWLSDGVNVEDEEVLRFNVEFGINGVGR